MKFERGTIAQTKNGSEGNKNKVFVCDVNDALNVTFSGQVVWWGFASEQQLGSLRKFDKHYNCNAWDIIGKCLLANYINIDHGL